MSLHELVQAFQDESIDLIDQYFADNKIKQNKECKQDEKRTNDKQYH